MIVFLCCLNVCVIIYWWKKKCSKNSENEEIECEVVDVDHVYEKNNDTDFKIETIDNFSFLFNEFDDISQDSFKNMVPSICH